MENERYGSMETGGRAAGDEIDWNQNADKREAEEKRLWKWNLAMGILHLVQAIIVLSAGLTVDKIKAFKVPLTTIFLEWTGDYPEQQIRVRNLMPFAAITSIFAFLSAAAHFTVLAFFDTYITDLRKGLNRFRWYEYALSSSVMIFLIATLFGMYDIVSLLLLVSLNASMNLFGYLMETMNQLTRTVDWTPFWFGCFAGLIPWVSIFAYIGGIDGVEGTPNFVWGILVSYLIFFNTFPINMVAQYKRVGKWNDAAWGYRMGGYYYGEKMYQVQSLCAKSLLLWLVFGGVNQPNKYTQ